MDIFVINVNKMEAVSEELLNQFGYKSYRNEKQKKIHQFSYLMLDRILKEVYKIENRSVIQNKNNKPVLKSEKKHFSISHSGEYIVLCFSDYECGIDIEKIKARDYKKIAERMGFKASTIEEFYLNWTKYEAEYKLEKKPESIYSFGIPEYMITVVSDNKDEVFDTYYNN